jgi:hypothetical protein
MAAVKRRRSRLRLRILGVMAVWQLGAPALELKSGLIHKAGKRPHGTNAIAVRNGQDSQIWVGSLSLDAWLRRAGARPREEAGYSTARQNTSVSRFDQKEEFSMIGRGSAQPRHLDWCSTIVQGSF